MGTARRYELTDEEWNKIEPLLPPENTGGKGRPSKDNRTMFNGALYGWREAVPRGAIYPNGMGRGKLCTRSSANGLMTGFWIIFSAL